MRSLKGIHNLTAFNILLLSVGGDHTNIPTTGIVAKPIDGDGKEIDQIEGVSIVEYKDPAAVAHFPGLTDEGEFIVSDSAAWAARVRNLKTKATIYTLGPDTLAMVGYSYSARSLRRWPDWPTAERGLAESEGINEPHFVNVPEPIAEHERNTVILPAEPAPLVGLPLDSIEPTAQPAPEIAGTPSDPTPAVDVGAVPDVLPWEVDAKEPSDAPADVHAVKVEESTPALTAE